MTLTIDEEPIDRLAEHGAISIAFTVDRILNVSIPGGGVGGIHLTETPVAPAWSKDYDARRRASSMVVAVRHLKLGSPLGPSRRSSGRRCRDCLEHP